MSKFECFMNSLRFCAVNIELNNGKTFKGTICPVVNNDEPINHEQNENCIKAFSLNDENHVIGIEEFSFSDIKSSLIINTKNGFYLDNTPYD